MKSFSDSDSPVCIWCKIGNSNYSTQNFSLQEGSNLFVYKHGLLVHKVGVENGCSFSATKGNKEMKINPYFYSTSVAALASKAARNARLIYKGKMVGSVLCCLVNNRIVIVDNDFFFATVVGTMRGYSLDFS